MNKKEMEDLIEKERDEAQIVKGQLHTMLLEQKNIYELLSDPEAGTIIAGNTLFEKIKNLIIYYEDELKNK